MHYRTGARLAVVVGILAGGAITFLSSGDAVQAVGGAIILVASLAGLVFAERAADANDQALGDLAGSVSELRPEVWMRWDLAPDDDRAVVCSIYEPRGLALGNVAIGIAFASAVLADSVVVETIGPGTVHGASRELSAEGLRVEGMLASGQSWRVSARTVEKATEPDLQVFTRH